MVLTKLTLNSSLWIWFNGRILACQASDGSSILPIRTPEEGKAVEPVVCEAMISGFKSRPPDQFITTNKGTPLVVKIVHSISMDSHSFTLKDFREFVAAATGRPDSERVKVQYHQGYHQLDRDTYTISIGD